jgi:hypothetical protein
MVRPSALAVLRLITSLKRGGCSTGRSAGFSPFRTLSAQTAAFIPIGGWRRPRPECQFLTRQQEQWPRDRRPMAFSSDAGPMATSTRAQLSDVSGISFDLGQRFRGSSAECLLILTFSSANRAPTIVAISSAACDGE